MPGLRPGERSGWKLQPSRYGARTRSLAFALLLKAIVEEDRDALNEEGKFVRIRAMEAAAAGKTGAGVPLDP